MKVIDLAEAKRHLEVYARECESSPVVVTLDGKPAFEMIPIRSEDPDFIDRLLASNPRFRRLMEARRKESESGRVASLEAVRQRLDEAE
jgi:PHD/YefM family antitoxin component YafN of YafNO toxin-antitoxin module